MKIITGFEQNSLQWLDARAGVVTASEFDSLITPLWKPRTGEGVTSYVAKKLAEKWLGRSLEVPQSFAMEQGHILEDEARPYYEFLTGDKIQQVAFVSDDDGRIGCSPDGLIGDDCGIEIKCPRADTHVRYLLAGEVPKDYLPQVHFSLFVTGRKRWKFLSYARGLPPLLLTVERDETIQAVIGEVVEGILARLDLGFAELVRLNGGERPPPPRRPVTVGQSVRFTFDDHPEGDVMP